MYVGGVPMSNEDEFGIVGVTLANAFHVERVVAHGGFAIVYRGIHGGFRAPIALKCLRIPDGMTELQRNTFLERFREEGELLFRLSAAIPEVVRPLHIDAVYLPSGALMPFLALEWLEGEGFDQVLYRNQRERKGGMDLLSLVDTLRPVAHALARAHNFPSEGGNVCVVHRDLKPENLFVCNVAGAPSIKILDYGIAEVCSVAQKVSGVRSWRGMNPFTPGYGAPEQWAPDRYGASGAWTDVWGLAVTMSEALAGKPAIDGDNETMRRMALDPRRRPTPRSLGAIVSNEVDKVFQRALAVDPRERIQDMEAFWTELEMAAGLATTMQRSGGPAARKSQRRASQLELELADAPNSIDLDLAVPPESLRASRASMASIPPGPKTGEEEDLPMYDGPPPSGPPASSPAPRSWPRPLSVPPPRSSRSEGVGGRISSIDLAPQSARPSRPSDASAPHARAGGLDLDFSGSRSRSTSAFPGPRGEEEIASGRRSAGAAKGKYLAPSLLLAAAVVITLLDLVAVRVMGEPFSLGPVRSFWLAGPLALAGAGLLLWKIIGEGNDG